METIKYIGTASTRIIREGEWEVAGVTKQNTVIWNSENGWAVPAGELSQAARDAIKGDPFFVVQGGPERVEQQETIDLDLAAETEMLANKEATDSTPDPEDDHSSDADRATE